MTMTAKLLVVLVVFWMDFRVLTVNVTSTVKILDGIIQGTANVTISGRTSYFAFRGIPFAQPPIGELRFKPPVKNSNWSETYNATYDRPECVQGLNPVSGSEDCLYINVYVPVITNASNLSVMVWIFGGGFRSGNSSYETFGPDYILDEGVIFVSFNYRLGVFGFLSTEDLVCPGNWGLKDQILALKWVNTNIACFGGNPNNVTIFGGSAGSASVSYLLQTYQNKTEGLFNAAIMESGQSTCLWALNVKAKRTAFEVGLVLRIFTDSTTTLVEQLRTIEYSQLQIVALETSTTVMSENVLSGLGFGPVIEPVHDEALFVNKSNELLKAGVFVRVPLLIGYNSLEAASLEEMTAAVRAYLVLDRLAAINFAPYDISSTDTIRQTVANSVRMRYFGSSPITASDGSILEFVSEDQFNRPIRQVVTLVSSYTPTYFYVFGYMGILSGVENRTYDGTSHGEMNNYIFRRNNQNYTEADLVTRTRLCRLFANFAKYGNPTPFEDSLLSNVTWPTVNATNDNIEYYCINSTLSVQQNPNQEEWVFYQELYDLYGDGNYSTY